MRRDSRTGTLSCRTSRGGAQSPMKPEFAPMSPGPEAACSIIVIRKRDSGAGLRRHQTAQRVTAARQARANGAYRDTEDLCRGLIRHPFEPDEQDYFALLPG